MSKARSILNPISAGFDILNLISTPLPIDFASCSTPVSKKSVLVTSDLRSATSGDWTTSIVASKASSTPICSANVSFLVPFNPDLTDLLGSFLEGTYNGGLKYLKNSPSLGILLAYSVGPDFLLVSLGSWSLAIAWSVSVGFKFLLTSTVNTLSAGSTFLSIWTKVDVGRAAIIASLFVFKKLIKTSFPPIMSWIGFLSSVKNDFLMLAINFSESGVVLSVAIVFITACFTWSTFLSDKPCSPLIFSALLNVEYSTPSSIPFSSLRSAFAFLLLWAPIDKSSSCKSCKSSADSMVSLTFSSVVSTVKVSVVAFFFFNTSPILLLTCPLIHPDKPYFSIVLFMFILSASLVVSLLA